MITAVVILALILCAAVAVAVLAVRQNLALKKESTERKKQDAATAKTSDLITGIRKEGENEKQELQNTPDADLVHRANALFPRG
jgi:archaellin